MIRASSSHYILPLRYPFQQLSRSNCSDENSGRRPRPYRAKSGGSRHGTFLTVYAIEPCLCASVVHTDNIGLSFKGFPLKIMFNKCSVTGLRISSLDIIINLKRIFFFFLMEHLTYGNSIVSAYVSDSKN